MSPWGSLLRDWRWPLLAAAASFAVLLTAHGFERFGNMPPCDLCLRQREVYWALISMCLVGVALWKFKPNPRFLPALNALIGLVFVTGAVVAGFHAGVEYGWWPAPEGCTAPDAPGDVAGSVFGDLDLESPAFAPACTDAPWTFGLSMAGWNVVVSLMLAAASFAAARVTTIAPVAG
ncbi:MAG: disulfide bond formation protein B [Pseudomonadota bacterium]